MVMGGEASSSGSIISRVDKDFKEESIQGSSKFQNINGKPAIINAVETDDFGRTYFAGDFHGHDSTNSIEFSRNNAKQNHGYSPHCW